MQKAIIRTNEVVSATTAEIEKYNLVNKSVNLNYVQTICTQDNIIFGNAPNGGFTHRSLSYFCIEFVLTNSTIYWYFNSKEKRDISYKKIMEDHITLI